MGERGSNSLGEDMGAYKMMIVDDEMIIATQLKEAMASLGQQVVGTASSGKEAIYGAHRVDARRDPPDGPGFHGVGSSRRSCACRRALRRIRKAGDKDVLEIEVRFRTKDGNWIRCTSREAVFERNEQGKVIRVIGSLLDISGNQKDKD